MAESISPERMQRLMELSNNAMTVELGALRNPQVTTVPLSEPEAFYKTTPNVERFRNNMLRRQYKIIEDNNDKLQFEKRYADADPLPEHIKRELNLEIIDAQKEIEKIKNYTEEAVAAHVKGLQLETVADIEGDFSLSGLDQARDQIVLSDSAEDTVLAHELGHGAFSEAKDFFLRKIKELGSITAAEEAVSLEYGEAISRAVAQDLRNTKTLGFPDTNEGTVQYYDNPQGDDPLNPGVGTPTFKGGATYYSPDGGFQGMDADFPKTTDPLLQKPFTDYRTGELVYHDEYKGGTEQHDEGDFETDLKKSGLMGFETLMSDLISEKKGLDRFAERQRRGLKINPLGAPKGEVLRSVRPQTRPENFAQGGPVMRGIGTLNETARNMTRGPRGIGAYQQFSYGGPVRGDPFNGLGIPLNMPYGPAQQLLYQQPQFGMGGMQQGNGINLYGQYLERTYGDPEFDQKRDTFLQDVQQKERQTFGGGGGSFGFPAMLSNEGSNEGYGLDPSYTPRDRFFGLEKAQNAAGGLLPNEMQLFASGGEAMGPPPTRGPDPQGIGYFQQFADGGPVYMQEGGESSVGAAYKDTINKYAEEFLVNPDVLFNLLKTESNFNPKAVNKASGAQGLAQVMPDTAADPGYDVTPLSNPFNAEDSIRFSAEYLSAMLEEFRGDYDLALAAYNAGPGRVRTYRGVPPFAETQKYIEKILGRVAPDEKQGRSGSGVNEQGEQVFTPRPLLRGETGYREELEGMPLKPRMRPSSLSQGIMAAQDTVDPAVIDRVVEQVQEELPPTQEERDLYERYSPENMFPDAGLTEGEMIRRERFAPKEGDAEPYRQPPSTLEQIDQFFQRFAPSRKPERVIQPKPTPMQYRSA